MAEDVKLGFDEVVDTLADIIETGDSIVKVFADGFQPLEDLISLTPVFPRVQEIVTDAPLAWKQFKDLDTDEAATVRDRVADRLKLSNKDVEQKIVAGLRVLARVYALLAHNVAEFHAIKTDIEQSF